VKEQNESVRLSCENGDISICCRECGASLMNVGVEPNTLVSECARCKTEVRIGGKIVSKGDDVIVEIIDNITHFM
jgi:hypothetical protein